MHLLHAGSPYPYELGQSIITSFITTLLRFIMPCLPLGFSRSTLDHHSWRKRIWKHCNHWKMSVKQLWALTAWVWVRCHHQHLLTLVSMCLTGEKGQGHERRWGSPVWSLINRWSRWHRSDLIWVMRGSSHRQLNQEQPKSIQELLKIWFMMKSKSRWSWWSLLVNRPLVMSDLSSTQWDKKFKP